MNSKMFSFSSGSGPECDAFTETMRARPVANSTKSTTPLPSASNTLVIRVSRRPSLSAGKRASSTDFRRPMDMV